MFAVLAWPYAVHFSYAFPRSNVVSSNRIPPAAWPILEMFTIRGEYDDVRAARMRGRMERVKRKWARWSIANCFSCPSSVSLYSATGVAALFIRTCSRWAVRDKCNFYMCWRFTYVDWFRVVAHFSRCFSYRFERGQIQHQFSNVCGRRFLLDRVHSQLLPESFSFSILRTQYKVAIVLTVGHWGPRLWPNLHIWLKCEQ